MCMDVIRLSLIGLALLTSLLIMSLVTQVQIVAVTVNKSMKDRR